MEEDRTTFHLTDHLLTSLLVHHTFLVHHLVEVGVIAVEVDIGYSIRTIRWSATTKAGKI